MRSVFTTVTPLPAGISREVVMETLHSHLDMIDLNPLVEERHPIKPPPNSSAEEYHCQWYALTDRVQYLPGGMMSGKVTYNACFHDLANGLQTHCYAPMGLDIKGKWSLGGSLPGEPVAPVELGLGAPLTGLWLREDVDMNCNFMMTSFVKKTLKKAHSFLVARIMVRAQIVEASQINQNLSNTNTNQSINSQANIPHSQTTTPYGSENKFDDPTGAPPPPSYNQYTQSPNVQHQQHLQQQQPQQQYPTLHEDGNTDHTLYPRPLSTRSSSASYRDSITESQRGRASYQDSVVSSQSTNGHQSLTPSQNATGKVSWQQLNTGRSSSTHQIDPGYQNANPYRESSQSGQSHHSVELASSDRWDTGRQGQAQPSSLRQQSGYAPPPPPKDQLPVELE